MRTQNMDGASHDWIENFGEFEAVLSCQNELDSWESDGVTRAYQTYGWDDGSTPGNDSTYVHTSTGVIVRHDGGVVAIECGQGDLGDALPDLFDALHALGWRSAYVYHPPETMNQMLADMGRAIPARLNFDVHPAPTPREISHFAEGASLLDRSMGLKGATDIDRAQRTVYDELRSMDSVSQADLRPKHPITLEDDAGANNELSETVVINRADSVIGVPTGEYYDEEPATVQLPVVPPTRQEPQYGAAEYSLGARSLDEDVKTLQEAQLQFSTQEPTKPNSGKTAVASSTEQVGGGIGAKHQLTAALEGEDHHNPEITATSTLVATAYKPVRLGNSILCFDFPSERLTEQDIRAIAAEMRIYNDQLIYVRPGALGERVRWDVLGELSQAYPGFAETLATLMSFTTEERSLLSLFLLTVKNSKPHAQLRDVLLTAVSTQAMQQMFSHVSPAKDLLLADNAIATDQIKAAMLRRLGPLALIPAGQAFVDLPNGESEGDENRTETFTVLSEKQSAVPRMFVFQIDEMDSPFVIWMAELLETVARIYAMTNRYKPVQIEIESAPVAEPIDIEKIRHETAQEAMAQLSKVVGGIVAQLNALVPDSGLEKAAA